MIRTEQTYKVELESGKVMNINGLFLKSMLRGGECKVVSWRKL